MSGKAKPDLAERRAIVVDTLSQAVMALAVERGGRRSASVGGSASTAGDNADQAAGRDGDGPEPHGLPVRGMRR